MTTNFPTSTDTFTHPNPNDPRSGSTSASGFVSTLQDAVSALETKVGVNSSADNTSQDYKLSGVTTGDKAMSKTGTETATNKTFTAPKINIGGDATGDIYYRDSGGAFQRLPVGSAGQILDVSASLIPEWIPNPAASDASTTVKGVSEIATDAEVNAGTATGSTGAILTIAASSAGPVAANKIVQFTAATKYPAADGSLITNLATNKLYVTTSAVSIDNTEKTLMTATVIGNTLGTNNAVRGMVYLSSIAPEAGSARTYVFKFKYGATTVITSTLTTDSAGGALSGWYEFALYGAGGAGSQKMTARALFCSGSLTISTAYQTASVVTTGTSSEDSTADKTLAVTVQSSTSGSVGTFDTGFIEKIF